MKRSTLPPHSAGVWVPCPGSIQLVEKYPELIISDVDEKRITARKEGRAFHQLIEIMLNAGVSDIPELIDTMSNHGVTYSQEIYESAQLYVDDVIEHSAAIGAQYQVEEHIKLDEIYDGMYGYIDASAFNGHDHLVIWDGKFGHKFVEVENNWQVITYVIGKIHELGLTVEQFPDLIITIKVVQPRSFHRDGPIRSFSFGLEQAFAYHKYVQQQARTARSDDAQCIPGAHCGSCDATRACEALASTVYGVYDHLSDTQGLEFTGTNLSIEYEKLKKYDALLKARLDGIETQLISEVQNGAQGLLHSGEAKYGRLSWDKPRNELIQMCQMFDVDVVKETEAPLKTPTQIKAELKKKGVDGSVINAYSSQPMTGVKLVEIGGAKARKIFKQEGK